MYTSLNTGALGIRTDLAGTLALAKTHGFAGIDFSIVEVATLTAQYGIEYVRQMFTDAGLHPGVFSLPVDFRRDEIAWREGLDTLPDLARLAQSLNATRCITWIIPFSDERTFADNFRWHVQRLRPIAEILEDYEIRLGLEFVGPPSLRAGHRYSFVHSLDGMLALCSALGTPNVGLLLDSYHWHTSYGSLDDLAKLTNSDIVAVHINDALAGVAIEDLEDLVRALPCETGVINLVGFMKALDRMSYDGPITVEPFSQHLREMSPNEAVSVTAESLRRLWAMAGLNEKGPQG